MLFEFDSAQMSDYVTKVIECVISSLLLHAQGEVAGREKSVQRQQ